MSELKMPKILLIDKNSGGSFLLFSQLKDWGFEVVVVNSFLKAVDYCKGGFTPELVIVDMHEPGVLFYEFPRKFLDRTGKVVPFIAHSNVSIKEVIIKTIQSGYGDYLVRPVEPDVLLDKISNIINPNIELNAKTFQFHLKEEAKLLCPIFLDSVNEFGMQASVPFLLSPGTLVDLESPSLQECGLHSMCVRVVDIKSKEESEKGHRYLVKLSFVGLKASEITKLRKLAIFKGAA